METPLGRRFHSHVNSAYNCLAVALRQRRSCPRLECWPPCGALASIWAAPEPEEDRADFAGSYSMDTDILRKLEARLRPLHARQRLGIESDDEAQVFGEGGVWQLDRPAGAPKLSARNHVALSSLSSDQDRS